MIWERFKSVDPGVRESWVLLNGPTQQAQPMCWTVGKGAKDLTQAPFSP